MTLRYQFVAGAVGLAVLALVPVLASALNQPFYLDLFRRVMIFALAAMSLDLILGFGGMVSLAQGTFVVAGGFAAGYALELKLRGAVDRAAVLGSGQELVGPRAA